MRLDQAWGRPASGEILPARRGAAARGPPGHAGCASSEPLQDYQPNRAPESAERGRRRCLSVARAGRVPSLLSWVAARHLQLTSPKFSAPSPPRPLSRARFAARARACTESGAPFSWVLGPEPSSSEVEGLEEEI